MTAAMIRPPDPAIVGVTMTYMPISSADACRRLVHLAFRDAHSALDLTYASGGFWRDPLPPGLSLLRNTLDISLEAEFHRDFTDTNLPDQCVDLVVYDPPHVADAGVDSIMGRRFGTVKGTAALRQMIEAGASESWRLARVGVLVKIADHSHGGELLALSDWVKRAVPMPPYAVLHTYRPTYLRDGKHRAVRAPRSNGATYLAFRRDGHRHRDFDRLYARQVRVAS